MASLRQEISVGSTGDEFVAAFTANTKNANIRVYNVEDYGAVHDGETDDTEAIQDAINACVTGGGGDVYFPIGIYLLSGALKSTVLIDGYNVPYNSQLYIPASSVTARKPPVRLIGEAAYMSTIMQTGRVILRSTIAGTGLWPSVIASRGLSNGNDINYTDVIMENISIQVNGFFDTTGISMCGINFLWASHPILKYVTVGFWQESELYTDDIARIVKPTNHVFGIGMGITGNDFGEIRGYTAVRGFYYGYVLGEGINCDKVHAYHNYVGLMTMSAVYGCTISHLVSNWNTIDIAGQLETVYDTAGKNTLIIQYCSIERWTEGRGPAWLEKEYYINDPDNYLFGKMDFRVDGGLNAMTLKNGGTNFLARNAFTNGYYHWTTAGRPTSPDWGLMGLNINTAKMEMWTGYAWVTLDVTAL